jgi:hypothetical protein
VRARSCCVAACRTPNTLGRTKARIEIGKAQTERFTMSNESENHQNGSDSEEKQADKKRKSDDERNINDEEVEEEDDSGSNVDDDDDDDEDDDEGESDDSEELEQMQTLMDQIQEAKEDNKKLKEALTKHNAAKRVKPNNEHDHSQLDYVNQLFKDRQKVREEKDESTNGTYH